MSGLLPAFLAFHQILGIVFRRLDLVALDLPRGRQLPLDLAGGFALGRLPRDPVAFLQTLCAHASSFARGVPDGRLR